LHASGRFGNRAFQINDPERKAFQAQPGIWRGRTAANKNIPCCTVKITALLFFAPVADALPQIGIRRERGRGSEAFFDVLVAALCQKCVNSTRDA
jgi:hypothetical protein